MARSIVVAMMATVAGTAPAAERTPISFNGDAKADLVVGIPYEAIGTATHAGAVNVVYGASPGLTSTLNQLWHQDTADVLNEAETDDEFGFALASGDFDGDGVLDLAVGVHGEGAGAVATAGAVQILYGVATTGLAAAGNQFWYQDTPLIWDLAETDDRFAWALAAGDFNGDGRDDLAVGVIWEDVGMPAVTNAGAVNVLYGSASGLSATDNQLWYRGDNGLLGSPEAEDRFGHALVTGDFNGDGYDDLVVGVPYDDVDGLANAGSIQVIFGSLNGLTGVADQLLDQSASLVEAGDMFGFALAAGDADGDGFDDLVVGVPYEDVTHNAANVADAGQLDLFVGSAAGLSSGGWFHQGDLFTTDLPEAGDLFGYSLAGGDFDCNGHADVAVGVPYESVGDPAVSDAGAVHVMYFDKHGLDVLWHQSSPGVAGGAEAGDRFGHSLASADFNGDGFCDLAVGVPWEDLNGVQNAGAVNVLYGSTGGLSAEGNQLWAQDGIPDIAGTGEAGDLFGLSLAGSRFAVGIFADGFEDASTGMWSATTE